MIIAPKRTIKPSNIPTNIGMFDSLVHFEITLPKSSVPPLENLYLTKSPMPIPWQTPPYIIP